MQNPRNSISIWKAREGRTDNGGEPGVVADALSAGENQGRVADERVLRTSGDSVRGVGPFPAQFILFLTIDPAWPPISGAELRNWENARAAGQFGEVTLASVVRQRAPERVAEGIRLLSLSDATSESVFIRPSGGALFDVTMPPSAVDRLEALLGDGRFDVAVIEAPALHPLLPVLRRHVRTLILDLHNIDSRLYWQLRPRAWWWLPPQARRLARTRATERSLASAVDEVWVCSELDGERLEALLGRKAPTHVVPNIVPSTSGNRRVQLRAATSPGPVILLHGHLSYRPNVEAARFLVRKILPLLREKLPEASVVLAGRNPHRHVAALAGPGVEVVADPPQLEPLLMRSDLAVLPIAVGSGTRIKVLEALCWGVPIVATRLAVEGLRVTDGTHYAAAETAREFVDQIVALWNDEGRRRSQADAGVELVARHYVRAALARAIEPALGRRMSGDRPVRRSA